MYFLVLLIIIIFLYLYVEYYFFINNFVFDINYSVYEIENVLTPSECNELINISQKIGLKDSAVLNIDDSRSIDKSHRLSKQVWLKNDIPLVNKIMMLSEKYTGISRDNQELLQVVNYDIGGKFNNHYDAFFHKRDLQDDGFMNRQRRTTFMIYLNEDYSGGETEFPLINKKIYPKTGNAIIFENTDENEYTIFQSLHRGNPIINGNKWICNIWSHSNNIQ